MANRSHPPTPLPPPEWGLQPGMRVWVGGHNVRGKQLALKLLARTVQPASGPIDLAVIAPETSDEAAYFATKLKKRLVRGGAIWVIYPRNERVETNGAADFRTHLVREMTREGYAERGHVNVDKSFASACFRQPDANRHPPTPPQGDPGST